MEEETTARINRIYELAKAQKDSISIQFLENMLNEQLEEEAIADEFRLKQQQINDYVLWDATFKS